MQNFADTQLHCNVIILFHPVIKSVKLIQMESLYLDQTTADVTFSCGPEDCENLENVFAHKLMLAMHSPVFKTMFFGSMPEEPIIRITDATGDGFKEFLQFFYKDEINPTIENAAEVIYLLKKYEVHELLNVYASLLKRQLLVDQMFQGMELAIRFDMPKMKEICGYEIVKNHANPFDPEASICSNPNVLETILQLEELKQHAESIFFLCIHWARNELKRQNGTCNEPTLSEIRDQMGEHFDLIEFGSMKNQTIVMILYEFNDLFTKKDLATIHTILATTYPATLRAFYEICCEFSDRLNSSIEVEKHHITEDHVISFQSNKELFFVGYKHVKLQSHEHLAHYNLWLTLTKKSLNPDNKGDIVLLRKNFHNSFTFYENSTVRDALVMIEPNVDYEIRIKSSSHTANKYFTEHLFESKEFDPKNVEHVAVNGSSPVISSLIFKL